MFDLYCKELKSRNLNVPSRLLVVYAIAVGLSIGISFNIIFALVTDLEENSCWAPFPGVHQVSTSYFVPTLQNIFLSFTYPILGWLADTKIGRERAINLSLWSCWFGTLLQVISYCIQYGTCGLPVNIAKYGISGVALLLLMLGAASFYSNVLAYGMDQLVNGSSAQIRTFVHWLVWGLFVGFITSYIAFVKKSIYDSNLILITGIVTMFLISFVVIVSTFSKSKFRNDGILKKNPYKMVYQVLKYAWKHKSPENRSALTYWENKIPSRIDLGKEKYGGPFKEDEVEDTKTFWRMVTLLLSTFGIYIPYYTVVNGVFLYVDKLEGATTTLNGYGSYALWSAFDFNIIILVPLLELIVIPLFPKIEYFLLKPLKWIGISYILLLGSFIAMFIIDTVSQFQMPPVTCANIEDMATVNMSFLYYIIPFSLIGFIDILTFIGSFEFICSQAPANMNGMLTGVYWFIRALYISVGAIMRTIFFTIPNLDGPGHLTCTFWSLLAQFIVILIGGFTYMFTAYWYKQRQRGENYSLHEVVEKHYEHMLANENVDKKDDHILSGWVIEEL